MAVGETYLVGYPTDIGYKAVESIEKAIKNNESTKVTLPSKTHTEMFNEITLLAIIGAGLVDGINPCAFAVIVFFISFLSVYGYNKKEVIYVGIAYCSAVFLAYLLMGFGLFKFLHALRGFQTVIHAFYIFTIALCLILFLLAVYDLIVYLKTKRADAMLLQLPKKFKIIMNKVTGFFLREKESSALKMMIAAFIVGLIVSLIEAVCTGQVYIPTIVLIMKEDYFRLRAITYLVIYNLMFVLPLIVVFILSILGYKSEGFNSFLKKHLALTKLLLSLVFLGLAILLIKSMV
ncbi:Cytochrome c biogenesis protein CcdA [Parelusimicrobium proximum]|uniref:cytochrome c biogenesis CcdA family protein n=1 Tax=Parelusimicrobium proximum TaxID=3228953 RepID=UPI003D1774C5